MTGFATAQSLSFVEPAATALTALGIESQYTVGDNVSVQWTTPFEYTTLRVWEGPLDDGSYSWDILAANWTQAQTTFVWEAGALHGAGVNHSFHFEVYNGHDESCNNCSTNSVSFRLNENTAQTTSTSASSSTSTSATSTQSSTAATSPATTSAGSGASFESSQKTRNGLAIPLGIGLGVGIPVLLALLALLALCLFRRRKNKSSSRMPRGRQASDPRSEHKMQQRESDLTPLGAAYHTGLLYKPSPARSSAGTASSRSSFYEFDFERPGSHDFDSRTVMDELHRNSTHVRPLSSIYEDESGTPGTPTWPLPAHGLR